MEKTFQNLKKNFLKLKINNSTNIKEIKKLLDDPRYLDDILLDGSNKADKIASKKIKEIKN